MKPASIDINCDLGEGMPHDAAVMRYISSASIACGGHAGDANLMRRTVRLAGRFGVSIGAHPGFPDRRNFGRRPLEMRLGTLKMSLAAQMLELREVAAREKCFVRFAKPHGALYNLAMDDAKLSRCIVEAVSSVDEKMIVVGMPRSALEDTSRTLGLRFVREGFPDRAYDTRGRLIARGVAGAVISDPFDAAFRGLEMAVEGAAVSIDGIRVRLGGLGTLCVHGDSPAVVDIARALRLVLRISRLEVAPFAV